MRLNEIKDNPGATKPRKRVGRGIGSGSGKTAGKGMKGQKSRSGVSLLGFEGGQMPIYRRLPKRGFNNANFTKDYAVINVGRLQEAVDNKRIDAKKPVTTAVLAEAGLVKKSKDGVRLLGQGEVTAKLTIEVEGASKGAIAAVEKAGGTVTVSETALAKGAATDKKSAEAEDESTTGDADA